ncbi:uncharacterized protein LOC120087197 [Benincasa hispida]|uniref:uncharacterized protein LOC120087197 n=1 Tax=Benincasa hispida TaxID=102211 RepID=UPI0018FF463E|nr:uncharacterized protein LOC120087197 [Benincasa hispida]
MKERIEENRVGTSRSNSIIDDAISRVFGTNHDHVRGLGFGVTLSKLSTSTQKDETIASLERKCNNLTTDVDELKYMIASLIRDKERMKERDSNNLVRESRLANNPVPVLNSP